MGVVANVEALRGTPMQPAGTLLDGQICIASTTEVRGVATSGGPGGSQTMCIA
mgnify:CR=1 FL=1